LKSPLARLRSQVAALARHSDGNPLAPGIAAVLVQTNQILDLFSSLMRLWRSRAAIAASVSPTST